MTDIPRDLGQLAKKITSYQVTNSTELRELTELCRAFCMDAAGVLDVAEWEIRAALTWFDNGTSRRARTVTRPLRHAQSLVTLAARRCVAVWRAYLKQFEEALHKKRNGRPRFNPEN